jgi:hypothetical protein
MNLVSALIGGRKLSRKSVHEVFQFAVVINLNDCITPRVVNFHKVVLVLAIADVEFLVHLFDKGLNFRPGVLAVLPIAAFVLRLLL